MMQLDKASLLESLDPDRIFGEQLEAALDVSLAEARELCDLLVKKLPRLGRLSSNRKRMEVFFAACTLLENRMAQGECQYEACVLALEVLRVQDASFRRASKAFEDAVWEAKITSLQAEAHKGGLFARAYGRALYPSF